MAFRFGKSHKQLTLQQTRYSSLLEYYTVDWLNTTTTTDECSQELKGCVSSLVASSLSSLSLSLCLRLNVYLCLYSQVKGRFIYLHAREMALSL